MSASQIPKCRLERQHLANPLPDPTEVVRSLGALQAQDYAGSLWAIAIRTPGATEGDVEKAVANGSILRTWPMRGTLHFVAAGDVHWMLKLLTPRVIAASAKRHQELELDAQTFIRAGKILTKNLQGGKSLVRSALFQLLETSGIAVTSQRGYHLLWRLSQQGLICQGPREGKQPSYVLLEEWAPPAKTWSRDHSLRELARRYFNSHGPATLRDFAWWSGLKMSDARAAADLASKDLVQENFAGTTYWISSQTQSRPARGETFHLLPGFDEYLLGYQDRRAVLDTLHASKIVPGNNGMFLPTLLSKGRVVGTWKRTLGKKGVSLAPSFFEKPKKSELAALNRASRRYGDFLGLPVAIRQT